MYNIFIAANSDGAPIFLQLIRALYRSDAVGNCHSACAEMLEHAGGAMGTVGSDRHWRVDPKSIVYLEEIAQGFQVR